MDFSSLMGATLALDGDLWDGFWQLWRALDGVILGAIFSGRFQGCPDRHKCLCHLPELDPPGIVCGIVFKGNPFSEA